MGNTTNEKNNVDEFDEDIEEEFVDDFDEHAAEAKNSFDAAPLAFGPRKTTLSPDKAKNFINIAVIGIVILTVAYFGYSYFKKSKTTTKELPLQSQLSKKDPKELPSLSADKLVTSEIDKSIDKPTINKAENAPGTTTNPKISDLEFDINANNKNNALTSSINKSPSTTANGGLEAALAPAPDAFKPLPQNEDLFAVDNVISKPATINTATNNNEDIKDTLASITEEMTLNVNHIKQLEATITQISSVLEQLAKSVNSLDSKLSAITDAVNVLDQDINNIKRVMATEDLDLTTTPNRISAHKPAKDPLVYSTPDYVVHAIIPGRAWLKSTGGQIITITEGDQIGDYGKVASIDATNNIVRTSSGITFR
jgi:hypothetical protein